MTHSAGFPPRKSSLVRADSRSVCSQSYGGCCCLLVAALVHRCRHCSVPPVAPPGRPKLICIRVRHPRAHPKPSRRNKTNAHLSAARRPASIIRELAVCDWSQQTLSTEAEANCGLWKFIRAVVGQREQHQHQHQHNYYDNINKPAASQRWLMRRRRRRRCPVAATLGMRAGLGGRTRAIDNI